MPDADGLGQFFTPRPVIDFAFDALEHFGATVVGARVIDPACGPGEWLRVAFSRGAARAVGIDCDPAMRADWAGSGLAQTPGGDLAVADGLIAPALTGDAFDLVVGNPPFGAHLADEGPDALRELARSYRLPFARMPERLSPEPTCADLRRLRRYPIELLFLERFVGLCREGGSIAIILPEGVLSNARWRHVRAWLLGAVTVDAVIGLPRSTFRAHATTARTCLLLMRRAPAAAGHEVALAEADGCDAAALGEVLAELHGARQRTTAPPPGLDPPLQRKC